MRDSLSLMGRRPIHAEGHYCVDLWDPRTRKIRDRVHGKNTVFTDALFGFAQGANWQGLTSGAYLAITDSDRAVDVDIPFLMGTPLAYGRPSIAGSGTYRGAYNAANQVLALISMDSVRWKFQYDFTTAQGNGTLKSIGLTAQYTTDKARRMYPMFEPPATAKHAQASDGRYVRTIAAATGIMTVTDLFFNTTTTIDVSAVVGTTSATSKHVGWAPATGKYYIWAYSANGSLRKMYEFSDSTFTTLLNTYSPSNITYNYATFTVYGDVAYFATTDHLYSANFVTNTIGTDYTTFLTNNVGATEGTPNYNNFQPQHNFLSFDSYIYGGGSGSGGTCAGTLFDMSTNAHIATLMGPYSTDEGGILIPYLINRMPAVIDATGVLTNTAIAAQVLSSPVTKTSSNGMTATYELEVFWE